MENGFFFLHCSNLKSECGTWKYLLKINQRLWEIGFRRRERDVLKRIKPTHRESHWWNLCQESTTLNQQPLTIQQLENILKHVCKFTLSTGDDTYACMPSTGSLVFCTVFLHRILFFALHILELYMKVQNKVILWKYYICHKSKE